MATEKKNNHIQKKEDEIDMHKQSKTCMIDYIYAIHNSVRACMGVCVKMVT